MAYVMVPEPKSQITNHKSEITNCQSLPAGEVRKARLLAKKREAHDAGRTIALLGDDQFRRSRVWVVRIPVVRIVAVDQDDEVGILLEGAGFPQIRQLWSMVGAR